MNLQVNTLPILRVGPTDITFEKLIIYVLMSNGH